MLALISLPVFAKAMWFTSRQRRNAHMSVERTAAGLQMVIPGCEWRSLPKSPTPVDQTGQGLLTFYKVPTLREKIEVRANKRLQPRCGQKSPPQDGLFA